MCHLNNGKIKQKSSRLRKIQVHCDVLLNYYMQIFVLYVEVLRDEGISK